MHPVAPGSLWEEPSAHKSHFSLRVPWAKLPSRHGVCRVEPVVAKWPGEASVHSLTPARLVAFEYDPAGHGMGTLVPSGQTWPVSQGSAS